jgi:hypothetical protein
MTNIDVDAFLARFADVVRVPQKNRDRFFLDLRCNFRDVRELARGLPYTAEIKSVGEIGDELIRAILNLNDEARSAIERGLRTMGLGSTSVILDAAKSLCLSCNAVTSLPDPNIFKSPNSKRFRPEPPLTYYETEELFQWWVGSSNWKPRPHASYRILFDLFLQMLARDILNAAGRFTVEKNTGGGTILPALKLLRDEAPPGLLPVGLIPAKLSPSTLQRWKSDWNKSSTGRSSAPTKPRIQTQTRTRGDTHSGKPAAERSGQGARSIVPIQRRPNQCDDAVAKHKSRPDQSRA